MILNTGNRYIAYFQIVFFLSLLIIFPVISASADNDPAIRSFDGLERVPSTEYSEVYRKPGIDFKVYSRIALNPVDITFRKNWMRRYNSGQKGLSNRVTREDMARMKKKISELFDEIFRDEISKLEGFSLVSEIDSDVLVIQPKIINLDVYAPEINNTLGSLTFVDNAGEGTLYLEFYDGISGEILARVLDRRKTRGHDFYQWASRSSKISDTKELLRKWARVLRRKLDEVHASK